MPIADLEVRVRLLRVAIILVIAMTGLVCTSHAASATEVPVAVASAGVCASNADRLQPESTNVCLMPGGGLVTATGAAVFMFPFGAGVSSCVVVTRVRTFTNFGDVINQDFNTNCRGAAVSGGVVPIPARSWACLPGESSNADQFITLTNNGITRSFSGSGSTPLVACL